MLIRDSNKSVTKNVKRMANIRKNEKQKKVGITVAILDKDFFRTKVTFTLIKSWYTD